MKKRVKLMDKRIWECIKMVEVEKAKLCMREREMGKGERVK